MSARKHYALTPTQIAALVARADELSRRFPPGTECVCTARGDVVTTRITGPFEPLGEFRVVVRVAGMADHVDAREVWVNGRRATDRDPWGSGGGEEATDGP